MEIIIENRTTNPPTKNKVFMEFKIAELKISPRLENCKLALYLMLWREEDFSRSRLSHFQNLNSNPTVIHARICVINSKIPVRVSPKKEIPIVPIMKRGHELLVKAKSLSACTILSILFL